MGINRPKPITLKELTIPDSRICLDETELVRACEPDFLFNHSVRTYLFGLAVAHNIGMRPDRELLYLASILHDVGLTPAYNGNDSFELQGARAARDFMIQEKQTTERANLVHEAIALHTSIGLPGSREPEIALMQMGAGFDVVGGYTEEVHHTTKASIVGQWPRVNFKEEMARLMDEEVKCKPHCYMATAHKLGFNRMIKRASFSE